MYYLASCSIVKNEDDYIDDFVTIHKHLGVEHFIFYDRSQNPLSERYKGRSDITVIPFPEPNRHADAWLACVNQFTHFSKWMALIDIDQALVPVKTTDIKEALQPYENFAAVQPNWHTFGSSGQKEKKPGSLYERFILRADDRHPINNHTQTVAQLPRILPNRPRDPHHLWMRPGETAVNERFQQINGPFSIPPSHDVLFFAHYITKSFEEYVIKCDKGRPDIEGKVDHKVFYEHDSICNVVKEERVSNIWKQINCK